MPKKFKIGDKVKISDIAGKHNAGKTGTIIHIREDYPIMKQQNSTYAYPYVVKYDTEEDPPYNCHAEYELETADNGFLQLCKKTDKVTNNGTFHKLLHFKRKK